VLAQRVVEQLLRNMWLRTNPISLGKVIDADGERTEEVGVLSAKSGCGIGSSGGRCSSLAGYVAETATRCGAPAAGVC